MSAIKNDVSPRLFLTFQVTQFNLSHPYNYFVTLENEKMKKKRTEISVKTSKPIFNKNKFSYITDSSEIQSLNKFTFKLFIALSKDSSESQTKLLGEGVVLMKKYHSILSSISQESANVRVKFRREDEIVGECLVTMYIMKDQIDQMEDQKLIIPGNKFIKKCKEERYKIYMTFYEHQVLQGQKIKIEVNQLEIQKILINDQMVNKTIIIGSQEKQNFLSLQVNDEKLDVDLNLMQCFTSYAWVCQFKKGKIRLVIQIVDEEEECVEIVVSELEKKNENFMIFFSEKSKNLKFKKITQDNKNKVISDNKLNSWTSPIVTPQFSLPYKFKFPKKAIKSQKFYLKNIPLKDTNKLNFSQKIQKISKTIKATQDLILIESSLIKATILNISEEEIQEPHIINSIKENIYQQNYEDQWAYLKVELAQKHSLIGQFLGEFKELKVTHKKTVNEINKLGNCLRVLKNEEESLRKRLSINEEIENQAWLEKELQEMSGEELRLKLIRVAQSFQIEREKNLKFELALKKAQGEVGECEDLERDLEILQHQHLNKNKELLKMQKEVQRWSLYQKTLKKQNSVIKELEQKMEACIKRQQKQDNLLSKMIDLEKDNKKIKREIKRMVESKLKDENLDQLTEEISQLKALRDKLKDDLESQKPVLQEDYLASQEEIQLKIELEKYKKRIVALEKELIRQSEV